MTPKTLKLLGSTEKRITKDKNGERLAQIEVTEVILVHCNIVNNQCWHDLRVWGMFVPHKSFGQLPNISPTSQDYLEALHSEFSYIEVWFSDQISLLLEIEDRINLTCIINDNDI